MKHSVDEGTHLMGISPHRNTECSGEPEIGKLEMIFTINEEILRFQISVQNAMSMAVEQTRGQLVSEFLETMDRG